LKEQTALLVQKNLPAKVIFKVARMQADPMISHLLITGETDLIISTYLDFAMRTGHHCV